MRTTVAVGRVDGHRLWWGWKNMSPYLLLADWKWERFVEMGRLSIGKNALEVKHLLE